MAYEWPNYDPTLEALLAPAKRHPYGLWAGEQGWSEEAVCAELARLAYFPFDDEWKPRLAKALAEGGFGAPECWDSEAPLFGPIWARALQWLRNRDAQAFGAVSLDGSTAVVAFRGTQANRPRDTISDMRFRCMKWDGPGRVHEGFWKAYQSLADHIEKWLESVGPRRLIITGHSLGAGMATVMAALRPEARLVTFGSPLVGDSEFVRAFEGRDMVRYVDCTDLVTSVPFEWLGYAPLGTIRYIDRDGVVHDPPPPAAAIDEDRSRARRDYLRTYALKLGNVPVRDFADHTPVNYVSAVAGKRLAAKAGEAAGG